MQSNSTTLQTPAKKAKLLCWITFDCTGVPDEEASEYVLSYRTVRPLDNATTSLYVMNQHLSQQNECPIYDRIIGFY